MTGLLFEHPEWVAGSAALFMLVAASTFAAQTLARRRLRSLLGSLARVRSGAIRGDLLLLAALLLTGVGLLGPRVAERSVLVSTRGADVVFLFDVSQSMDARDVAPSRIQRARQAVSELLERLEPEDRAALAAFAGRGVLLTPLTPDTAALREMLPALDTRLIRPAASDLHAGIQAALTAFEDASDRPRVLMVLSDGESGDRNLDAALSAALRANTRILAAAIGTEAGATIPDRGSNLRDSTGHIVVSRRRTALLAALAEGSDGRLFVADDWGRFDVAEAAREIGRDARGQPGELVERRMPAPMVLPFAALAFALLLLEGLPGSAFDRVRSLARRPWRARVPSRAAGMQAAALLCVGLMSLTPTAGPAAPRAGETKRAGADAAPGSGEQDATARLEQLARQRPLSAHELLLLGLARARADRWDEAENSFLAAAMLADDGEVAGIAYHDLGVAALRRGQLARARTLFFDSLARRPGDAETRFNLEWTLAALAVETPPEKPPLTAPQPSESGVEPEPRADETPPAASESSEPAAGKAAGAGSAENEPEAGESGRAQAPQLSEQQRQRWIERIVDDPAKALRSAAQPGPESRAPRVPKMPAW